MIETQRPEAFYGVVVIGRNEGERLRRCLDSVVGTERRVVYVDSGSTDGSLAMAREKGVDVVELDTRAPFTAARARNAGIQRLRKVAPDLAYVQFVDGDCEIIGEWLEKAAGFLDGHGDVAVVCGRRRERFPRQSVYNLLCDFEWDTPVGEAKACGGDVMIRAAAFDQVGGFRSDLIAGEEPELCLRLRSVGWRVWRLDLDMTLHDAAMSRFDQWWQRALRGGYAFAEGAHLHGAGPERYCVRESRRAWAWGLGIPLAACGLATLWGAWGLAVLAAYPLQIARLAVLGTRSTRDNWWRALFLVLGKFPEVLGQLKYRYHLMRGEKAGLIEYK